MSRAVKFFVQGLYTMTVCRRIGCVGFLVFGFFGFLRIGSVFQDRGPLGSFGIGFLGFSEDRFGFS